MSKLNPALITYGKRTKNMTPLEQANTTATHGEVVSLRDFILVLLKEKDLRDEQRFSAQGEAINAAMAASEKAVTAALAAADRAVLKAEISTEKRFEAMDEMRGMVEDLTKTLMPRTESNQRYEGLTEKINILTSRVDQHEATGAGIKSGWGYLIGAVGLLATIISLFVYFSTHLK